MWRLGCVAVIWRGVACAATRAATTCGEASGGGEAGPAASESGVADALDEQQMDAEDLSAAVETVDRDDTCPAERAPGAPTPRHACYAHFA